jgi:hypothetical protein
LGRPEIQILAYRREVVRFPVHRLDTHIPELEGMMDDMGIFRRAMGLENPANRGSVVTLPDVMVGPGSEYVWVPASVLEQLGISAEREARFATEDAPLHDESAT